MGTKYITSSNNTYKVYTALLTQTGGDDPLTQTSGTVSQGVTYIISISLPLEYSWDFSNVGGPIYPDNFNFVATSSDVPNGYGSATLYYNTGSPVATVLENTIGNIWFTYGGVGNYSIFSDGLFTENKTIGFITYNNCCTTGLTDKPFLALNSIANVYYVGISSALDGIDSDDVIKNTPIEIRVYE